MELVLSNVRGHDGGGYMISDLVPGDEGDLSPS
jgi:hypothetical protein